MTTLSVGISLIYLWFSKTKLSVPIAPVILSPWARLSNYFPNAVVHTSLVSGSLEFFEYFVMIFPVVGCITGAQ